ncbi:MAG: FAD-dependent oxidoreductase [Bdellovibrionia bacterium]
MGLKMGLMRREIAVCLGMIVVWGTLESNGRCGVRQIQPPRLGEAHLGKKILCHRPMRRGSPQLSVERVGDRWIANNYGHGGSGWTLGPASAQYVIRLLEERIKDQPKDTPIAIVGAGALGLFSAIELIERGYTDLTIVAESFDDLVSHRAGGLLAPVSMDNDSGMQQVIDQMGIEAYRFYHQIALGQHPIFKTGARLLPVYVQSREDSGLEPYVGKVMRPAEDVTVDFGNGTTREMVVYDDGIFMDTAGLMNQMKRFLETASIQDPTGKLKVRMEKRKIRDFQELDQKIIVNCTGMGSADLNSDQQMVSVQGHLILLQDQNPEDLNYMVLTYRGEGMTQSGFHVKRSFYIFPKMNPGAADSDVGVIGGTFIQGADVETPNEEEFQHVIQGAREFYGLCLSD